MEEKIFPRCCSRRGPCAARGGCGTLPCFSLLPCQSAAWLLLLQEEKGPCSWVWIKPFLQPAPATWNLWQGPYVRTSCLGAIQMGWSGSTSASPSRQPRRGRQKPKGLCVLVDSPQGEGKAKQGKAGQCKARPGKCLSACRARAQQPLFSWGWRVGGGAEGNKQDFQMSSSPLKSHSLKHICVSRAVCSKNRLSQLLFSVLSVGHLYGSFFCLFKSDPLVYKGSVQPELYRESCSQHFLIS